MSELRAHYPMSFNCFIKVDGLLFVNDVVNTVRKQYSRAKKINIKHFFYMWKKNRHHFKEQ